MRSKWAISVRWVLVLSALTMLTQSPPALAAYDRVVSWSDISTIDLHSVFKSHYSSHQNLLEPSIPISAFEVALRDSDSKISDEFGIPAEMRASVGFWLRIYTEYTTHHVVLFDDRHPDVIYEVLDFRELKRTARNAVVYEILRKRKVEKTIAEYKRAFKRLQHLNKRKRRTQAERNIIAALKRSKHRHSYGELAKNLRSQTGQRDNVIKGLVAAESYFPQMEKIFSDMGLPPELTRLSLVESSFNLNAVSRVGAAGVWQFMERSALEYMIVDWENGTDERLSPLKSTVAAAKLLKRNKRILKTWPLAITSYNHGIRGLLRIPSSQRTSRHVGRTFNPCSKKQHLGWASRNYYAEFLAILHAETYRELFYGEAPAPTITNIAYHKISKPQSALHFALKQGIPLHEFKAHNPDIRNLRSVLPKGYLIAMPAHHDDFKKLTSRRVAYNFKSGSAR